MQKIKYATLKYYLSPISNEYLCLGTLFHNLTTGKVVFQYNLNIAHFQAFDPEADIEFVKEYLEGIKQEVELFGEKNKFNIEKYIASYTNAFRFSKIKSFVTTEHKNFDNSL